MTKQVQKGGDHSTNVQAEKVQINMGVTISDVRQIARDIFKANFLSLSKQAKEVAKTRAEEITDKFLMELKKQNEDGIKNAQDPDFQYAMFTIQKEYAKTGDKELGDLLVDILVDRTKQEGRSILQIVLNESLSVAPKLTNDQLAALSVIFMLRYTINTRINNSLTLGQNFDETIKPFINLLSKKAPCYQHLEYAGCGSISISSVNFADLLKEKYLGLFSKGFLSNELQKRNINLPAENRIFVTCLHDNTKLQLNAINEDEIKEEARNLGIEDNIDQLLELNKSCLMNSKEVEDEIVQLRPYMKTVFDVSRESFMKNLTLTSVGIAIGHANVKRNIGEFTDLSIWIN